MNAYDTMIFNTATANGIPQAVAQLIVAQARHETGNYSSAVFKADNNAFGYKYVGQSGATQGRAANDGGYYAHYSSVAGSALELVNWLKRRQGEGKLTIAALVTPQAYANALKASGYYGDSVTNYVNGLIAAFKNAFDVAYENKGVSIAIILAIIGLFVLMKRKGQ